MERQHNLTSSHWGTGLVEVEDGRITAVHPHPSDPNPSRLNENIAGSVNGNARILRPAVRRGWFENRTGERGRDGFVEVGWSEVLELIGKELCRVRSEIGNRAIFAGSYGWASAGRFHLAQNQLKRFLNTQGGFVRSEGNYSYNAALVAMPHIVGGSFGMHVAEATRWKVVAENTDLVVMFGGMASRNTQICNGGITNHRASENLAACADKGVRFVNLSPLRGDASDQLNAEWLPPRPGTDTAVMLGLAHTLLVEGLCDRVFLNRFTVGFDQVESYLLGAVDGKPKTVEWAAGISGLDPCRLRELAREMAQGRTMLTCAAGLQRADWGEQTLWMIVTLAAMLGQIGLPGGGYTIGYAVNGNVGCVNRPFRWAALPQGENPVEDFIPVAMISEMLLNPGGRYRYNGRTQVLPDIRLLWWVGGNPFHHHQDLNRLRAAFQRPETIIVNEVNWTATAKHADIVLPVATAQERLDFGAGNTDNFLVPMPKLVEPPGQARVEFDIYAELAGRLGDAEAFTEGLDADAWVRRLWQETQDAGSKHGHILPDWDSFIDGDMLEFPDPTPDRVFLAEFRADPGAHPRPTPSGRIELYSAVVADFGLPDCPGHAYWNVPRDVADGREEVYPIALVSGQPATRLHSQFDNGAFSRSSKINGHEPVLIHPVDASRRGIADGDIVELFNERGRCLAGARLTRDILLGVAFLWTGAWFDPDFDAPMHRDRHGNPNVLTHDRRTSEFSQSPSAHSSRIEIRKFDEPVPKVVVHEPPDFEFVGKFGSE